MSADSPAELTLGLQAVRPHRRARLMTDGDDRFKKTTTAMNF